GDLVSVQLRSTSTVQTRLTLRSATGTVIAANPGTGTTGRDTFAYGFLIPATGAYFLQADGGGTGTYVADVYLSTDTAPPEPATVYDYYSFSLAAGESATLGLKGQGDPNVRLELVDGNDQVLATGRTTAANLDSVINNFVAPEAGTYYVRVTGRPFRDYNL